MTPFIPFAMVLPWFTLDRGELSTDLGKLKLVVGTYTQSGNSFGDREVWLQCVSFSNPNKGFFNMILNTLSLGSFVPLPWLVMSGKVKAPFRPRLSEVHLSNSQSVPLSMMGFEYINGLPLIYYVHLVPRLEQWPT